MMKRIALALMLSFAFACGDTEGDSCDIQDDCDDGQICAQIAVCVAAPCPGICRLECVTDEDCGEDQICDATPTGPTVCRGNTDPGVDD